MISGKARSTLPVRRARQEARTNNLVVDVGGTSVKILAMGQEEPRKFPSGPALTAEQVDVRLQQALRTSQHPKSAPRTARWYA